MFLSDFFQGLGGGTFLQGMSHCFCQVSGALQIDLNLRGENAKKNGPKIKKLLQILFLEEVECHS